ncbi:mobile mystery protein B [Altererythrobacter sp. Root672]|uniref:mobile mystery protein B n=1 Tax=Altererythrobacter sp. Root672 TaxID=1736584 RepID=UPI001F330525|nr:mobile mystery protein B [Altererythrobacter sp. Root672]
MDLLADEDGNTPLSAEERLGLIPSYVTLRQELNEIEQINITEGERWAFGRARDILDEGYLRELHRRMFGKVWKWAGDYSRENNRRIGSDSVMIPLDLRGLLDDVRYWIDHGTYPPDEIALRFHHRLTQIHPFPNGNGRFSRLAADLLAVHLGQPRFTWGRTNLVEAGATRRQYIDALRAADGHAIDSLLAFARS